MTEPRKEPNPTPEQVEARRQLAENRRNKMERKRRTRRLIQMGGVLAAYGFEDPEQVEVLLEGLGQREAWVRWLEESAGVELYRRTPKV